VSLDTTSLFPELESRGVEATELFFTYTEYKSWMQRLEILGSIKGKNYGKLKRAVCYNWILATDFNNTK
jgi:hypothetical protein